MTATKITILGSGTCVPRLDRTASSALVETGAFKILLDLGPGTMRRLMECGVTIFDLTHILITHFHPDHTSELVPLIFSTKYPVSHHRERPLTVLGGQGLKAFYRGLQAAYGDHIVMPADQLAVRELDVLNGERLDLGGVTVVTRPTNHRPESLAYRIEDDSGHAVVYSGDTDECESLIGLAGDADLFICESSTPDELKVPGHLTPSLAGGIARSAGVKKLVLTHLYPPCEQVDIVKQAHRAYKGEIFVAEDLMSFTL